jgi:transcriptional regulator NrdR family protein
MANFVVKKDGKKIPYDPNKIKSSIMAAAADAGFSVKAASETAQKIFDLVDMAIGTREDVPTSEIKERILDELDAMAPDISKAWAKYDQANKKK